jgi:RimJ/RimL family protein N-acetyltransferase
VLRLAHEQRPRHRRAQALDGARMILRQLTLAQAQAALEQGRLAWPGIVHPGALPPPFVLRRALAQVAQGEPASWWLPFLIVEPAEEEVVGGCAFKGAPRAGRVEVLYGISKACRGRGMASAAVTELAALAFARGATEVLAEIEPGNGGSIGVVRRCGFSRAGERTAEDGVLVEQWVLRAAAGVQPASSSG